MCTAKSDLPFFLLTYQIFAPTHKLNALYDDFSDYYLGVKNSNKGTSEFLTFICLNYGVFLAFLVFSGRFYRALLLTFRCILIAIFDPLINY